MLRAYIWHEDIQKTFELYIKCMSKDICTVCKNLMGGFFCDILRLYEKTYIF